MLSLMMAPKAIRSEYDNVFVRLMRSLMKADEFGERVVPIVPDEARTFGMDPLFSEFGIYAPEGQQSLWTSGIDEV